MELKLNLDGLFFEEGEGGPVRMSEALQSAVAEHILIRLQPDLNKLVRATLTSAVEGKINQLLTERLQEVLTSEYELVDEFGVRRGRTTLRQQIATQLERAMSELTAPNRHQASPLVKLIQDEVRRLVKTEVGATLTELRRATTDEWLQGLRAQLEQTR